MNADLIVRIVIGVAGASFLFWPQVKPIASWALSAPGKLWSSLPGLPSKSAAVSRDDAIAGVLKAIEFLRERDGESAAHMADHLKDLVLAKDTAA